MTKVATMIDESLKLELQNLQKAVEAVEAAETALVINSMKATSLNSTMTPADVAAVVKRFESRTMLIFRFQRLAETAAAQAEWLQSNEIFSDDFKRFDDLSALMAGFGDELLAGLAVVIKNLKDVEALAEIFKANERKKQS